MLAFATADPEVAVFSAGAVVPPRLGGRRAAFVRAPAPGRGAAGAARGAAARPPGARSLVSFLVGGALIAALVDIPLFARTTIYPTPS